MDAGTELLGTFRMGSYYGHVVPGLIIAFWGVAWLILTIVAHLKTEQRRKGSGARRNDLRALRWEDGYKHKSWLPFPCAPRLPIEPILKVFLAVLGMFVELFVDMANHDTTFYWYVTNVFAQPNDVDKAQHATMYSFFLLSGIIDLVTMGACCRFPKKTGQLVFALALWMEGSLFLFHTGGKGMLEARIHFILSLSVCGIALAATARVFFGTKVFVNLVLSVCLLFQGTWLVAIGFILFGRNKLWWRTGSITKDPELEHKYAMIASMIAAWHLLCIVTVVLVLWGVVMTLSHCGIKVLLPLVHVPVLPACFKERLTSAAKASQADDVLYERAKLMERATADLDTTTKETESKGDIGDCDRVSIAEIPTL